MNTDKDNSGHVMQVLEIIKQGGLQNKVKVYFARVEANTEVCANISGSCYSSQEYSALEVDLYRQALGKGFALSRYPRVIGGSYCTADRVAAYVIAPDGYVFKCWNQISDNGSLAVGHLLAKEAATEFRTNLNQWLAWDPFEKKVCLECNLLPICMGGCPYNARHSQMKDRGHCEPWKYHLMDMLNLTYLGHKSISADNSGSKNAPNKDGRG